MFRDNLSVPSSRAKHSSSAALPLEDGASSLSRNVGYYQHTLCNIPEERRPQAHRGVSLKPRTITPSSQLVCHVLGRFRSVPVASLVIRHLWTFPPFNFVLQDGCTYAVSTNIVSNEHSGMRWTELRLGCSSGPHASTNSTAMSMASSPTHHTTNACGPTIRRTDLCYRAVDEVPDIWTDDNCGVPRNPFTIPPPPLPRKIADISKLDAIALPHVLPFIIHSQVTGIM